MPTNESKRVQKQRRENFDRVPVLVEKGTRDLIHLMAQRDGITMAEYIRRAILSRAGLRSWPYPDTLNELGEQISDALKDGSAEPAREIIKDLQQRERKTEVYQMTAALIFGEPMDGTFRVDLDAQDLSDLKGVLYSLLHSAEKTNKEGGSITLTGYDAGILRRFLANMRLVDPGAFYKEQEGIQDELNRLTR